MRARKAGMGTEAIVNKDKRRFLIGATSVVGGIGAAAVAVPFVMSLWPSERAKAAGAPVEVDISKIEPGQKINVEWRGKVCWLVNRTPEMVASLPKLDDRLADPKSDVNQQPAYCKNETRSIKPNLWVAVGICTHLGCSPTFRPAACVHENIGNHHGRHCQLARPLWPGLVSLVGVFGAFAHPRHRGGARGG